MIQPRVQKLLFIGFVAAVVLGIYLPGLQNQLVFDDLRFKDTIFRDYGGALELKQRLLSYGSFVWIQALFGEGWWKQRIVNMLLHGGVVVSLYLLMRDLLAHTSFSAELESKEHFKESRNAALMVGTALFAVNPMAVYAVGYLVQRSIVMATLFTVLACWFFVKGLVNGRIYWHALAVLSYLCAVLSKEHAVMTAALAVPLYIFVKRPGWRTTAMVVGISLFLLAAVGSILYSRYGGIVGKVFDDQSIKYVQLLEKLSPGVSAHIYPLSILNEAALFFAYGFLWLVPNTLWMSIDLRPAFPTSFTYVPHTLGAIGFIATFASASYIFFKKINHLGFVALCLLIPIFLFLTEFATVWIQDPFVLYRSYLWAIAIPGLFTVALIKLKPNAIFIVGSASILAFGGLALERNLTFRDEHSIWNDAAEKININAPENAVGRFRPFLNLGVHLSETGSLQLAINNYTTAEKLGAPSGIASFNMGGIFLKQKKPKEALEAYDRAEKEGFHALTSLNYHKAESQLALGNTYDAIKSYSKAINSTDGNTVIPEELERFKLLIRKKRGQFALTTQQYDIAIEDYLHLSKSDPKSTEQQYRLAVAYTGAGKIDVALPIFDRLINLEENPSFYHGRAMAYFKAGNKNAGFQDLDRAIAIAPNNKNYPRIRAQVASGMEIK